MNLQIGREEVNIKTLEIVVRPRFWGDCEVFHEDEIFNTERKMIDEQDIPCREGENWCPIIDLDEGKITNWEEGLVGIFSFKVVDEGSYYMRDEQKNIVASIEEGYVPTILDFDGDSFGDYLYFNINPDGTIQNWNPRKENLEQEWNFENKNQLKR